MAMTTMTRVVGQWQRPVARSSTSHFLLICLTLTLILRGDVASALLAPSPLPSSSQSPISSLSWSYSTSGTTAMNRQTLRLLHAAYNSNQDNQSHSSRQLQKQQQQQQQSPSRTSFRRRTSYSSMKAAAFSSSSSSPPPYPVRVAVMGGGNFGIALATVAARHGIPTTLLVRSQEVAHSINTCHVHPRYMTDFVLPPNVRATIHPKTALADATYIIHAVPCQYSRQFLEDIKEHIPPSTPILSASKGIETSSLGFMNDIFRQTLGEDRPYAFLSGPSFAREICEGVATAVVIASDDFMLASDLAALLSDDSFRVFTSRDVMGVEVGGAVKNVIALAAGMCEGLGLGTNAMSGLVTRGCGEMRRLGITLGGKPSTLAGLSGVGDTFGTCFGPLSRNRKFGYRLGQGETMDEIRASTTEVAEGVDTSIALVDLIKTRCKGYRLDLKYPILFGVASILQGTQTPKQGLEGLMRMPFMMESFEERFE